MTYQPIDEPIRVVDRRPVEWLPYLLSLPALLVCIGILIPFVTALYYSTLRFRLNLPALKGFIWFGNYTNLLYDAEFWNTVSVSLRYTAITVGVELVFGLIIALLLQRQTRLNNLISVLLLLPLMTAPAIASLMWKLMTNPNFGILSYLVSLAGVSDFRWASSPSTALFTVVLVDVWVYTPFMMVLLLAGLRSLPSEPVEAASIDGASRWQVFWHVTLPLLRPYILVALLLRTIFEFRAFDNIYVMTSGGPANATMTLSMFTYLASFVRFDLSLGAAASWLMLAMCLLLCLFFIAVIRRRDAT